MHYSADYPYSTDKNMARGAFRFSLKARSNVHYTSVDLHSFSLKINKSPLGVLFASVE